MDRADATEGMKRMLTCSIQLPVETYKELKELSRLKQQSFSSLMRRYIDNGLALEKDPHLLIIDTKVDKKELEVAFKNLNKTVEELQKKIGKL